MRGQKSSRALDAALVVVTIFLIVPFIFAPSVWAASQYKTLYRFKGGSDGSNSTSTLIFDKVGNLYGTTQLGGTSGVGTVFKLTPNGNGRRTESVLYSFKKDGKDGMNPVGGLIFDQTGNLYGTTRDGGNGNVGAVFTLTPNRDGSWTETVLYSFKPDNSDGHYPFATLVFDSAGNLFGTTQQGGEHDEGTVFDVTQSTDGIWTENCFIRSLSPTDRRPSLT